MIAVAHYRRARTLLYVLSLLVVLFALGAFSIMPRQGLNFVQQLVRRPDLAAQFLIGWLGGLVGVWIILVCIWRLLFEKGRALWIDDGALIFLHKRNMSVPLLDIVDVSEAKVGRFKRRGIRLTLANGTHKSFPTAAFREPPRRIALRIREARRK